MSATNNKSIMKVEQSQEIDNVKKQLEHLYKKVVRKRNQEDSDSVVEPDKQDDSDEEYVLNQYDDYEDEDYTYTTYTDSQLSETLSDEDIELDEVDDEMETDEVDEEMETDKSNKNKKRKRNKRKIDLENLIYDEADISPLQKDIINEYKKMCSKEEKEDIKNLERVKKSIDKTMKKIKEKHKDILMSVFEPVTNRETWKIGVEEEVVNKIQTEYNKIMDEIEKEKKSVCEEGILNSNMPYNEKKTCMEKLEILRSVNDFTHDYFELRKQISEKIKHFNETKIDTEILTKMNDFEKDMKIVSKTNSNPLLLKLYAIKDYIDEQTLGFIYSKYIKMNNETDSETRSLSKVWLENVVSLPFNKMYVSKMQKNSIHQNIIDMKSKMDSVIYGLDDVKEQILCIMNNKLRNPTKHHIPIALKGPPGTGKTVLASCIAETLDLPFQSISLAGINDNCILKGRDPGWVGAQPGRFAKMLQQLKHCNGVVLIDEVDKVYNTPHGLEVQSVLLDVLEYPQNNRFVDNFIGSEIPIDLSNIIWILSLNNDELLDTALISRMNVVEIPEYTTKDKYQICKTHIIPSILETISLPSDSYSLDDDALYYLINNTNDKGVRVLRNKLTQLFNKISLIYYSQKDQKNLSFSFGKVQDFTLPVHITIPFLRKVLSTRNTNEEWLRNTMYT